MAKKRRKPHRRPPSASAGATGVSANGERPDGSTSSRGAPQQQRTRAAKKDLARQRREQERRREKRARFIRLYVRIVAISGVIAIAVFWFLRPEADEGSERPATLPGELTTEAPWPANTEQMTSRVEQIGLPPEGTTMHEHANLQLSVHGEPVAVPSGIGVAQDEIASLHTHDETGTIHVESQQRQAFTLGEFFDVWGVRLSGTCLGGYCARGGDRIRAYVGGEEVRGNPRDVVLDDRAVIAMTFGTQAELPDPIPSTFDFSSVPQ